MAPGAAGTLLRPLVLSGSVGDVGASTDALVDALQGGPPVAVVPAGPGPAQRAVAEAMLLEEPVGDSADPVAVVLATSGSAGPPKGVELTRSALLHAVEASTDRLGGAGDWLLALPLGHAGGLMVLLRSIVTGTSMASLPMGSPFQADAFVRTARQMDSSRRRYVSLVPTQLARLLADDAAAESLADFDAVLVGGDATPRRLLDRAVQREIALVRTYGMTETAGGCVYDGTPLDGVAVSLTADGRIQIDGPVVALGYRGHDELNRRRLAGGRFLTNDRGRWDASGRLEVLGRLDDAVTSGGMTVSLARVESHLLAVEGVQQAAAAAVSNETWGRVLVAAVVLAPGSSQQPESVRDAVRAHAEPAEVPRAVVAVEDIPRLSSGKVDRGGVARLVVSYTTRDA